MKDNVLHKFISHAGDLTECQEALLDLLLLQKSTTKTERNLTKKQTAKREKAKTAKQTRKKNRK